MCCNCNICCYIAYLKSAIKFCIQLLACQHNDIENLANALESNNKLLDKQCEWNNSQVAINEVQRKFNNEIEKRVNNYSPTGGRRSEAEAQ